MQPDKRITEACPMCGGTGAVSAEQLGIGGMIILARKKAGMSQQQLADAVSVTRAYIAGIETGRSSITVESVRAFAAALNIDPVALIP